jgi:hypothetical protein
LKSFAFQTAFLKPDFQATIGSPASTVLFFSLTFQTANFALYYCHCAGRIAAIAGDCKSPVHRTSLVRVQPGAQIKKTAKPVFLICAPKKQISLPLDE